MSPARVRAAEDRLRGLANARACVGNAASLPFEANSFDLVFSRFLMEYLPDKLLAVQEMARVCKRGGIVITISPVSWPYHEAPVDCWRMYPEGMKALYAEAGLADVWSWWGSLEASGFRRFIPGRSPEWQPRWSRLAGRTLGWLGLPVETAYDMITIGRKV